MRGTSIFEDLVLKVEASPKRSGSYQIRVDSSPCGETEPVEVDFPFRGLDPRLLLQRLDRTIWRSGQVGGETIRDAKVPSTSDESSLEIDPKEVGKSLFTALSGPVRETILSCLATIESHPNKGLRIRLKFDPELAGPICSLPWELLYRHETREFLSRNVRTPMVRHLNVNRPMLSPVPLSRLRVLVVLSDPQDVRRLNVARERKLINDALGGRSDVDLRFLEKPTLSKLRREVRNQPFDVLHFVGHGDFDQGGEGVLCFEDDSGRAARVTGSTLADNLKGFEQIRLVLLNACETACMPRTHQGRDPYQGVSYALIMAGIPAVIAMQCPITDRAAIKFSSAFYSALVQGDPLENAVVEARLELASAHNSWEWATPVLFLGVPHGNIFQATQSDRSEEGAGTSQVTQADLAGASQSTRLASTESGLEMGLEFLLHQRYEAAIEALSQVTATNPQDASAAYYLGLARLQGRRPRSLRADIIKQIEADLWKVGHLLRGQEPAHFWFFQALIKHDFYRMNGLRIQPPTVDELLAEAEGASADVDELRRLLDHVPTPSNPVRQAIEARLVDS